MHFNDALLMGPVVPGGPINAGVQCGNDAVGPTEQTVGLGPLGRVFTYNIIPLTLQTNNVALAQTTGGAGNLVLTAGTGVTSVTQADGTTRLQLDVPRALALASTANLSAVNFTISGYDVYGQAMTDLIAGPNNNTVTTLKAFWQVTSIAVSGAVGTNVTVGTSDIFGLPVRVDDAAYIISVKWNETLAPDAGTFVVADTTSPATNATGDVRGTYKPSANASNGTRRLCVHIHLTGKQCGSLADRISALGVTNV